MVSTMAASNQFLFVVVATLSIFVAPSMLASNFLRVVDAAHPRRRVTIRRQGAAYDREITTFTEDGRLAQVEYGLEASLRGSTVGAILVKLDETGDGKEEERDSDSDTDDDGAPQPGGVPSPSSCVVVCIEQSSYGKMHRIDDHLWMLTAGLSGDARMLANQARRACQNHRLRTGEAPTTLQAARITADFYHQLTRLGGCRPLGCSAILVGVDETDRGAKLLQVDPGGGYEECTVAAVGNRQDTVAKGLMALNFDNEGQDETGRKNGGDIPNITTTMAEKFLRLLDGAWKAKKGKAEQQQQQQQRATTLDVWTIQPTKHHRGGMLATCYSDVRKDNLDKIVSLHTRQ